MCMFSVHVNHEVYLSENLEKLGNSALQRDDEEEIGTINILLKIYLMTQYQL